MVGLVSKGNPGLYKAASGWVYQLNCGCHFKRDLLEFTILDHSSCVLQVRTLQKDWFALISLFVVVLLSTSKLCTSVKFLWIRGRVETVFLDEQPSHCPECYNPCSSWFTKHWWHRSRWISCWSWKLFMVCVFDRGQTLYLYCIEGT